MMLEGSARVLVVDDEPVVRRTIARALMARRIAVDTAEGGRAALDLLRARPIDAVLLDRAMPDLDGFAVLAQIKEANPDVEVVMMVPAADPDAAARALREGAYDVAHKPIESPDAVARALERAAERRRLGARIKAVEQRLSSQEPLGEIVFASGKMLEIDRRASSAASTSSPVLVIGERGTGKELLSRAIHRRSNRSNAALHVLRLADLPETLAASEIASAFEESDGGTLILDDIGDLGEAAQSTLARMLNGDPKRADVRVIATALPSIRDRVKEGAFREDLFYRLAVIPIDLPPLRRRRDDIPILAYHYLSRFAPRAGKSIRRIGVEALRLLRAHPWPGNVRELSTVMEHAVVMAKGDSILPADLPISEERPDADDQERLGPEAIAGGELFEMPYADAKERAVQAFDRAYAERLMARAGGNVSEAARLAGMDRSNFRRMMKRAKPENNGAKAARRGPARDPSSASSARARVPRTR